MSKQILKPEHFNEELDRLWATELLKIIRAASQRDLSVTNNDERYFDEYSVDEIPPNKKGATYRKTNQRTFCKPFNSPAISVIKQRLADGSLIDGIRLTGNFDGSTVYNEYVLPGSQIYEIVILDNGTILVNSDPTKTLAEHDKRALIEIFQRILRDIESINK